MSENNGTNNPQWEDPTPKAKPKGKGPIIGIAAIAVAAVVGIGLYASGLFGNFGGASKPDQVSQALASLLEGNENPFVDNWIGSKELTRNMMKGYNFSGNLELVDVPSLNESVGVSLPKGIMLSFEGASDAAAKTGSAKLSLGMMGTNVLSAELFGSQSKLQMAVPALFKEVITADITGDLEAKIKAAPLLKDIENNEETSAMIKAFAEGVKSGQSQSEKMIKFMNGDVKLSDYKTLNDSTNNFKAKWSISDAQSRNVMFNGKQENFRGYQVTVKKADYIAYLKEVKTAFLTDEKLKADFTDMIAQQTAVSENITKEAAYTKLDQDITDSINKLEQDAAAADIVFTVHMTKENKLVSLSSQFAGKDNTAIKVSLERNGGDFLWQNSSISISQEGGTNPGSVKMVSAGKTDGNTQTRQVSVNSDGTPEDKLAMTMDSSLNKESGIISAKITGNTQAQAAPTAFEVVVNGKLEDVVKDKSAALVLDEIRLTADQQLIAALKGEFKYNTENVSVKEPAGTPLDLFTATETDLNNIMEQIQTNLGGLLGLFLGF